MQVKELIPWGRKDRAPERTKESDNPVATLQKDLNSVFDRFWNKFDGLGGLDWPWGQGSARSDVVETENAVEVSMELPGMDMNDIEILVTDDFLTVKGEKRVEREEEKKGYYLSERSFGSIYRSIPLPPGADADKADARFLNGVLTVKLPQTPEAKAKVKKIEVKSA